jgi:tetratricopeptide (TPR) repeat protein
VNAHHWLAYVYLAGGDFANALRENQEALRLEPLYLIIRAYTAFIRFCMGDHRQALEALDRSLEIDDTFSPAHHIRAWVLAWMERYDDATKSAGDAAKGWGDHRQLLVVRAVIAARRGKQDDATAQLDRLRTQELSGVYVHPFDYACIHAALGQREEMLASLELAAGVRFYWWFVLLGVHPLFKPYHEDDRFQAILSKLGLRQ